MVLLASPTGSLIEAETVPITASNPEALISQIILHHPGSVDQDSEDISLDQQNSDKKKEDEQAKYIEGDYDDNMSDTSILSASTLSSPIWTPLEASDFSKHDQVIADISTHRRTYEAMALDLGWEYSYAAAVLEQEDMREYGVDLYGGVINFDLRKYEESDDDEDLAMLVVHEVRYWQAQLYHGIYYHLLLSHLTLSELSPCFDLIA